MRNLTSMENVKDIVEVLLKKNKKSKSDLFNHFGLTRQGLEYKLKANSFNPEEIRSMAEFFEIEESLLLSGDVNKVLSSGVAESPDKLLLTIEKIEKGFSTIEESYKSLLDQKDEVIRNQNFMIKILLEKSGSSVNFLKPANRGVLPLLTSLNVA